MGKKDKKCIYCREQKLEVIGVARYGYKGGVKLACSKHRKDDMINLGGYICTTEDCLARAAFGYPKNSDHEQAGKVLKCGGENCRKPGMVNLLNITCYKCDKQPNYNLEGEKKAIYCKTHANEWMEKNPGQIMIDVKSIKCKECKKVIASYGNPQTRKKEYCATCAPEGSVELTKKLCEECNETQANWNFPGEKGGRFCAMHALDGMIDLLNKLCKHPGCLIRASYGVKGNAKQYCAEHASDDMFVVSRKKCKKCGKKSPSYGYPGGEKEYCAEDKLPGMVPLKYKTCEKCDKVATFNFKNIRPPKYCKAHSEPEMIDITARRCESCMTTATIGIPGQMATRCKQHREKGMIAEPRTKCKKCKKNIAL